MVSLRDYCKAFLRTRDISELIPFDSFISDQICATKSFSLISGFHISALDDECLNANEIKAQVEEIVAANNLLEPHHRQYQVLFRNRNAAVPVRVGPQHSPEVIQLETRRRNHLIDKTRTASIEIVHFLESLPSLSPKTISRMGIKPRRRLLRQMSADFDLVSKSYSMGLPALDPVQMTASDMQAALWRLLHPGARFEDAPRIPEGCSLADLFRDSQIYWDNNHGCLRIGDKFLRLFSLRDWPDASEPNLFANLLKVDVDFTLVTTWQPKERLATQEELIRLRNLMINIERDPMGTARKMREDPSLREVLQDAGVQDDLRDVQQLLMQIRRRRHAGMYSMLVMVHADSAEELEKPVAEIKKTFRLPMASLHEENAQWAFGNVIPVFFSCLPGNGHFVSLRSRPLRNDHHAELSTVWGCDTGYKGDDFAAQYGTRLGPVYQMARKHRLVANRAVVGQTRSGKSVAEIDYIGSLQVYNPLTRIYDASRSYEPLTHYFRGSILRCSLGEWNVKVSPFAGDLTDPNHREFCRTFIQFLAELNDYECTYLDLEQLDQKLAGLLNPQVSPEFRRLRWLHSSLEGNLKNALAPWIKGGRYGHLFDHSEDELVLNDFQLFQFEAIQDGSRHVYLEALLLLLIHRDMQIIMDPRNLSKIKHITFDEVMSLCKTSPRLATFIQRILQGMQKYNVSLSLVSQSPEDYGQLEPFVLQNCSSFCFFPSPKISDEILHRYGMDDARIEVFRALKSQREFLFHGLDGRGGHETWKTLLLTVDPYRYWMSTSTPEEVAVRERLFSEIGPMAALDQLSKGAA